MAQYGRTVKVAPHSDPPHSARHSLVVKNYFTPRHVLKLWLGTINLASFIKTTAADRRPNSRLLTQVADSDGFTGCSHRQWAARQGYVRKYRQHSAKVSFGQVHHVVSVLWVLRSHDAPRLSRLVSRYGVAPMPPSMCTRLYTGVAFHLAQFFPRRFPL